jgi:transcriptional regulator with XRE-family HTH domain
VAVRSTTLLALGQSVRHFREVRQLSQESLGFAAGLDRGERNPTFESLSKLARALEVELSQIVQRAERQGAGAPRS